MILRDVLPYNFLNEFADTQAAKYLDVEVVEECDGWTERWPGKHRHVYIWWKLANGKGVGLNENPGRGHSYPIVTLKRK